MPLTFGVSGRRLVMPPYTGAEIPPASAPSGFDFAAIGGFNVRRCTGGAAPLRMTRRLGAPWGITFSWATLMNHEKGNHIGIMKQATI